MCTYVCMYVQPESEQQISWNSPHSTRFSCCSAADSLLLFRFRFAIVRFLSVGRDFGGQFIRNAELASPFDMEFEMT